MSTEKTKQELHRLVSELPDSEVYAAKRYLEYLRASSDPVLAALLSAPEDDEPITPDEDEAAEQAWNDYLSGKTISAEDAKRELLS